MKYVVWAKARYHSKNSQLAKVEEGSEGETSSKKEDYSFWSALVQPLESLKEQFVVMVECLCLCFIEY